MALIIFLTNSQLPSNNSFGVYKLISIVFIVFTSFPLSCLYYTTSEELCQAFWEKNIYYLTRYGQKHLYDVDVKDVNKDYYFVLGKESTGIPPHLLKPHLDHCMRIPMTANVRALNLSNSVAIMVYEVLRQQDYPNLLRTEPFKGEDYLIND